MRHLPFLPPATRRGPRRPRSALARRFTLSTAAALSSARWLALALVTALCAVVAMGPARAATAAPVGAPPETSMGFIERPADEGLGPVTLHYPSRDAARPVARGAGRPWLAPDGTPADGNGRLVVISHGTGGAPWVHGDLARALVAAGYVVAIPEHRGDTYRDDSDRGTFAAMKRRPGDISRTIDAVAADPRFGPRLDLRHVGVYGMSAGGFTALSLAGGRWSTAQFVRHCDAHLAEDWHFCTGVITTLTGGWLDGPKQWLARQAIHHRFDGDTEWHAHTDPRVAAVVAAVPAAAMFDLTSLREPRVPLGLVTMGADRWLVPRFHAEAVLAACQPRCERVAHRDDGGHGAMLSPLPPGLDGTLGEMLNDPPGFDRAVLPAVDQAIVRWFDVKLGLTAP